MDRSIKNGFKVCVTGGSGFIGSYLVKKLLERGYTVHTTTRNLDDVSKVSLLKSFPGAATRLVLFKADIYTPEEFESAIQGCECVFHVAHQTADFPDGAVESAGAGAKSIATACVRSGTVRRLIYTASIVAASPLNDDGSGFKDSVDETCWTPLNLSIPYANDFLEAYRVSKTEVEKELLRFGKENGGELEAVVTLGCGLVGGDSLLAVTPGSVATIVSPITGDVYYTALMYIEELVGKVPLVHIEDVCEAHIFCLENQSVHGRVLCASSYLSTSEIARHFQPNFPSIKEEYLNGPNRKIEWTSSKLTDKGFVFKFDVKKILDDSIDCAKKRGGL